MSARDIAFALALVSACAGGWLLAYALFGWIAATCIVLFSGGWFVMAALAHSERDKS